jgi:undecaprenyl-diphosphatase
MKPIAIIGIAAVVCAAPLGAAAHAAPDSLDLAIVRGANSLGAPALDLPMNVLSNRTFLIGSPLILAVVADHTQFKVPAATLVAEGLAYVGVTLLKPVFGRERPYVADPSLRTPSGRLASDPYSFPSGHSAVSIAAATVIADARPDYAWPAYGLAVLICYSRMYNGVHYPTDLLGGALLGFGIGKATTWGMTQVTDRLGWPISTSSDPTKDAFTLDFRRTF